MLKLIILILVYQIYAIENVTFQTHEDIVLNVPPTQEYYNKKEYSARKFLQLYNSLNPVVLLVDDTRSSLRNAASFLENLHRLNPRVENLNFMLMKFNAAHATPVLATTKNNKHKFTEILNGGDSPSNIIGNDNRTGAVFAGIVSAVNMLPENSGLVVFMKKAIEDEFLAQHTLIEVRKKRIQVFVVWSGKSDEHLLEELTVHSHGAFTTTDIDLSEVYYERFLETIDSTTSLSLLAFRKNLQGEYNLNFPIDSDVTGIHISITPSISRGMLTMPNGYNIDVLNGEELIRFSVGSFVKRENGMHEIHLNTTTATQSVGLWRLYSDNARALYNITIYAHTKITTNATIAGSTNKTNRNKIVKLGITGDVSSLKDLSFINEDGKVLLNNVKYTLDKNWDNYLTENIETNQKKEIDVSVEEIPKQPFYLAVNGKDSQGNDFQRLSYVRGDTQKEFYLPPITIQVGLGSELITQPLRQPQVFFEVTNNGNTPIFGRFSCRDEKGILLTLVPRTRWINPQETATVRLTLITRPGSYQDFITFTATGTETVTKKAIVDVGVSRDDRTDPVLDYRFTSDCSDLLFGSCEDGTWTAEVKAKDTGSGLLQVTSIPRGLHFPNGFTAGTTEEVTGYFSESCCNPDLKLVAFDRQNNRRSRQLNAYRANLSPGAIAAIVLGVLFLILIIILIVFLCRRCSYKRKQKGSYDLPIYRGPRRT